MKKLTGILLLSTLGLSGGTALAKTCIMNNTDKVLVVTSDASGQACHSYATITSNTGKAICYNDCGSNMTVYNPRHRLAGRMDALCTVNPGTVTVVRGYNNNFSCYPNGLVQSQ